ncbi:MAG: hypothetical protein WD049_09520 [Candidatus Paceibacterota bacterium]
MACALVAQGALRNAKWRTMPFLRQLDWTDALNNNSEYDPKLRPLFDGRANEPSDDKMSKDDE